ncbi:hypothetical protein V8D89_010444 [Ganoderma adspersum]
MLLSKRKCDLWSLFSLVFFGTVIGESSNRTIDDEFGDSVTKLKPFYSPPQDWFLGSTCPQKGCPVVLDPSKTLNGTWHETVDPTGDHLIHSITLQFFGTAVYVYGIVVNAHPNATTLTNMTFSLDDSDPDIYTHPPDSTDDILYQQLFYSKANLSNTDHALVIAAQPGSIAMFDYAEYTFEDSSSSTPVYPTASISSSTKRNSSSFPVGSVVGGVVGGVGGLFLVLVALFMRYKHRRGLPGPFASSRSGWRDRGSATFVQIDGGNEMPLVSPKPPSSPILSSTLTPEAIPSAVSDSECEVNPTVNPHPGEHSEASGAQVPSGPRTISLRLEVLEVEVAKLWEQHGTPPPQYTP